jgi:negative regulator of genetic competence, sporulation and motility
MEIIKCTKNKLKVIFTEEDMKKYRIKASSLDYNDKNSRKKFREILEDVKEASGFDYGGEKILIQLYPSKDGGCEMFITKLGQIPRSTENAISNSESLALFMSMRRIFRFSSPRDLAMGLSSIKHTEGIKSDIYLDEGGGCYLEIKGDFDDSPEAVYEYERLIEFSEYVDKALFPYITERCKRITEGDAIGYLSGDRDKA